MSDPHEVTAPVRRSYVVAAVIFVILAAWVASGEFNTKQLLAMGGEKPKEKPAATASAETEKSAPDAKKKADETPAVRVATLTAEPREQAILIRGQTQALRKVRVEAETSGRVAAIRADKGATVKAGDTICELAVDERKAMLKQATANMRQRELEYQASKKLQDKGFRSETTTAGAYAQYEAARAQVERMEKELEQTRIRAPFDGVVDERATEVGDFLSPGQPCATVIDQDPFLVVGQISEKDVGAVSAGAKGWAKLVSGERIEGVVRFVAKASDPATRTFRLELEVANPEGRIRDGITAEIHIVTGTVNAHRISPAILALDDNGEVGVRIVDSSRRVRFAKVTILSDGAEGVWVAGLPDPVTVITVGQDYVKIGQEVKIAPEDKPRS